jgi:hypothetical protein
MDCRNEHGAITASCGPFSELELWQQHAARFTSLRKARAAWRPPAQQHIPRSDSGRTVGDPLFGIRLKSPWRD